MRNSSQGAGQPYCFLSVPSCRTMAARARVMADWVSEGGVLLLGYEMYRLLTLKRSFATGRAKKSKKRSQPVIIDLDEEDRQQEFRRGARPAQDTLGDASGKGGPSAVDHCWCGLCCHEPETLAPKTGWMTPQLPEDCIPRRRWDPGQAWAGHRLAQGPPLAALLLSQNSWESCCLLSHCPEMS